MTGIELINKYYRIGDIVHIDDLYDMYYELTWRDLYEDNKNVLQDEGFIQLILWDRIKMRIYLDLINGDSFKITDIKEVMI